LGYGEVAATLRNGVIIGGGEFHCHPGNFKDKSDQVDISYLVVYEVQQFTGVSG
jgi:hypothetical protein